MSDRELELLARAFFRYCAENSPLWKKINVLPEGPQDLKKASGFKAWSTSPITARPSIGGQYDSYLKLMWSAELALLKCGYQTTKIKSPTPSTISVNVAKAGCTRLWVRVPKNIAKKIIILGFVPQQ